MFHRNQNAEKFFVFVNLLHKIHYSWYIFGAFDACRVNCFTLADPTGPNIPRDWRKFLSL
jgi:hypothetical protein